MAKSEQQGIDKIQCGRIDFYIPLIFETKFDFCEICKKINNGLDKDITSHYSAIQQDACIFRKNCASVPEERSAIPLQTEQSSAG